MSEQFETVAFRMQLNPGQTLEYRRRHDALWPELAEALKSRGVLDYRIFLDPERLALFAVMKRRKDHRLDDLPSTQLMKDWWAMMSDIMSTNSDQSPQQVDLLPMFELNFEADRA